MDLLRKEDYSGASDIVNVGGANDAARAGRGSALNSMDDSLGGVATEAVGGGTGLDEAGIRAAWTFILGFDSSEPIRSKEDSSDGLMTAVREAARNLRTATGSGPELFRGALQSAIKPCNDYIDRKNPLLPKGRRRKRAVIALRDYLQGLVNTNQEKVSDVIGMQETFASAGAEETAFYRDRYAGYLKGGFAEEKEKNESTTASFSKYSGLELGENVGTAIRTMNKAGLFTGNNQERKSQGVNWAQQYNDVNTRGAALEPVFDFIMARDPGDYTIDSPTALTPAQFVANYRILEMADFALRDTDTYADYIKGGKAKYDQDQFKALMTKLFCFRNLLTIYEKLRDVILDPEYGERQTDLFNLLNYTSDDINDMNVRTNEGSGDTRRFSAINKVFTLKREMESHGYSFGDRNLGKMREDAAGDAEAYIKRMFGGTRTVQSKQGSIADVTVIL